MKEKQQGILFIILAGFFFASMSFFVRLSGDLPTMEKAFFRNAVAVLVAAFMLARTKEGFHVQKGSWPDLLMRSFCGTVGLICNFYAVDHMNIADANILNKLSPFFAILMSYFILKEKANKVEWACVAVAFIGAVFVVKPAFNMQFVNAMIGVIGGLGAGIAYTFVRKTWQKGRTWTDYRHGVFDIFLSVYSSVSDLRISADESGAASLSADGGSQCCRRADLYNQGIYKSTGKGNFSI